MTDKGPGGSTREKSKDGRYTTGQQVEDTDPEHVKQVENILRKQATRNSERQNRNSALDKNIYEPVFLNAMYKSFLPFLEKQAQHIPGAKPVIIRGNNYSDLILGIDWIMFVEDTQGDQTYTLTLDAKVVEKGLGNPIFYENPNITLNLYKTENGQIAFKEHSFLNKNHLNDAFCYIVPFSPFKIEELDPEKTTFMDTKILKAKMFFCRKKPLRRYVQERILDNDNIKQLIHDYEQYKIEDIVGEKNPYFQDTRQEGKNTFRIQIPVAGENFKAELYLKEDQKDGHREVRVFLPGKAFENPNLKTAMVKELNFNKK